MIKINHQQSTTQHTYRSRNQINLIFYPCVFSEIFILFYWQIVWVTQFEPAYHANVHLLSNWMRSFYLKRAFHVKYIYESLAFFIMNECTPAVCDMLVISFSHGCIWYIRNRLNHDCEVYIPNQSIWLATHTTGWIMAEIKNDLWSSNNR